MPPSKKSRCIWRLSLSLSVASLGVVACTTVPTMYPKLALVDQILKPREGFSGLTHRTCASLDEKNQCVWQIEEHKLDEPAFRTAANALNFICNIGGRRFKVCLDKAGFCRMQSVSCGWFCHKTVEAEFIPVTNYKFLLDANTRCFNKNTYPFGDE